MKSENTKNLKEEFFTRRMFYRFLFPSLISSIGLSFGNIMDALVVGAKLGTLGLAAIALIAPIYMVYNVMDLGIAIGGSVQYTRLLGEGRPREGVINFNQMLEAALVISFLFSIFGSMFLPQIMKVLGTDPSDGELYLTAYSYARILILAAPLFFINFLLYYYVRCDDNQRLASIGFVIGNITDIFLNIFFVIYLDMGVEGAILATVIGKGISICIYIPHFFFKWTILRFALVKMDMKMIWNSFRAGFSSSSQYLFQFVLLLVINHLLMIISGENGLAVFNVVTNASYVLLAVYEGMGATIQPLVGNYYGEKNRKAMKFTLHLALRWGCFIGFIAVFIVFIAADQICILFGLKDHVSILLGRNALRLYGFSALIGGFSIIMSYYYQAVLKERLVFLINILRSFIVYLVFILLFSSMGINQFWWVFPVTEITSLIVWQTLNRLLFHKNKDSVKLKAFENRIFNQLIEKNDDYNRLTLNMEQFCNQWCANAHQQYYVNLTVEEICQAIIQYGFPGMKDGYVEITLIANIDNTFELHIRDNAISFNPLSMNTDKVSKESDSNIDSIGILLVKSKAKEFFYRRYQGFNTLTVIV